jgi:hypothetical protein
MSPQHRQQGFGMCLPYPAALPNKGTLHDISGTAPLPLQVADHHYIYKQMYYLFIPNINSNGQDQTQNILNIAPWLKKKRDNIRVSTPTNQMPEGGNTSNS